MTPPGLVGGGGLKAGLGPSACLLCASTLPPCEKLPHSLLPPSPRHLALVPSPLFSQNLGHALVCTCFSVSPPWDSAGAAFLSGPLCSEGGKHPEVPGMWKNPGGVMWQWGPAPWLPGGAWSPTSPPARSRRCLQLPRPQSRASEGRLLADSRGHHAHIALHGRTVPVSDSFVLEWWHVIITELRRFQRIPVWFPQLLADDCAA